MKKFTSTMSSILFVLLFLVAFRPIRVVVLLAVVAMLILHVIRFRILQGEKIDLIDIRRMSSDIHREYDIAKDIKVISADPLMVKLNGDEFISVSECPDKYELRVNTKYSRWYMKIMPIVGDFIIVRNLVCIMSEFTTEEMSVLSETINQYKTLFKHGE